MKIVSLISILLFSSFTNAGTLSSIATFLANQSGVQGNVTIINGQISINLDFNAVDRLLIASSCLSSDLKYHLHTTWTYGDTVDRIGATACGLTYTNNHYDPWVACGPNTANTDCLNKGGCVPPSSAWEYNQQTYTNKSLYTYNCTTLSYPNTPYTCEVGDWSSKYGSMKLDTITNTSKENHTSYSEITHYVLNPSNTTVYALVIHCNDGTRAFCAPFISTVLDEETTTTTTEVSHLKTSFSVGSSSVFNGFTIDNSESGYSVNIPSSLSSKCSSWKVRIYNEWNPTDYNASTSCNSSVIGNIWDPTHSCISNSSSEYCTNGVRCSGSTNTAVSYNCDPNDPSGWYKCAIGDVYGRVGNITRTGTITDKLAPPATTLSDKAIKFTCTSSSSFGEFCFKINSTIHLVHDDTTINNTASIIGFVFSIFIGLFAAIFIM